MCVYWWFIYPTQRGLRKPQKNNWNNSRKTPNGGYKGTTLKRSFPSVQRVMEYVSFWVTRKGIKNIQKNETLLQMQKHQPGIFRIIDISQSCMLQGHAQYEELIQQFQIRSLKYLKSIGVSLLTKNYYLKEPPNLQPKPKNRLHMFSKKL